MSSRQAELGLLIVCSVPVPSMKKLLNKHRLNEYFGREESPGKLTKVMTCELDHEE